MRHLRSAGSKKERASNVPVAAVSREAYRFHGEWDYTCNGTRLKPRPGKRMISD